MFFPYISDSSIYKSFALVKFYATWHLGLSFSFGMLRRQDFQIWTVKFLFFCLCEAVLHPGWLTMLRPVFSIACPMIMFQYFGLNVVC